MTTASRVPVFTEELEAPTEMTLHNDNDRSKRDVHGWLMRVQGYCKDATESQTGPALSKDGYPVRSSTLHNARPLSIASLSSEDSVDLDELINANYASSMDDETDLPDLADLDLDDSDEEFFKLDESLLRLRITPTAKQRPRSSSQSSQNSIASQSTITASHVHDNHRISYSRSLNSTSTYLARPTTMYNRAATPAQSRSFTTESRLPSSSKTMNPKRASHIPVPSSTSNSNNSPLRFLFNAPTPQRTMSTRSATTASARRSIRAPSRLL